MFGTTGILEAILEHVPGKALFGVQRVSKAFQATILGSTCIQHKMLLRIRNKAEAPWTYRRKGLGGSEFEQVPASDRDGSGRMHLLFHPVDVNPSLDQEYDGHGKVSLYMDRKGTSKLNRRHRFTKQELEQLSITKGFLSDPHCGNVQVWLSFTLGVRLPTLIEVTSTIRSREPLTIDAIIAEALDNMSRIQVHWRGDGHIPHHLRDVCNHSRVPRDLLDELSDRTGLDVFFRFSDFSFHLYHTVAPTEEQRAAVASLNDNNS